MRLNGIVVIALCCLARKIDGTAPRIVGGTPAAPGEFTFQAALYFDGRLICGCTVLSADFVLTAGHCAYNYDVTKYTIYAGSNLISTANSTVGVVESIVHEDFISAGSYPNDVAILRVDPPFTLSDTLQPVKLVASGKEFQSGTDSIGIGWGMTVSGSPFPDELQKVNMKVYSDLECLASYLVGPDFFNICAGAPVGEGGIGTCGGDTGGALVIEGEQVGISSWQRVPCGTEGFPAVYTQVSLYIDWITTNAHLNN